MTPTTPPRPGMPRETFDRMFPASEKKELDNSAKKATEVFSALLKLQREKKIHQFILSKLQFPQTPIILDGNWSNPIKKKQDENDRITIRPESKKEGFNDFKYYIMNLKKFTENGYPITIPQNVNTKMLYDNPEFLSTDEQFYKSIFYNDIHHISAYLNDFKEIYLCQNILEKAAAKLQVLNKKWGFEIFKKYEIVLSLSGSNIRYNSEKKQITYVVAPTGLKRAAPCYSVIIHEMVHVGVDKKIVKTYNLSYWEKERLVDLICNIYLKDLLPYYSEQSIKDKSIDEYVTENTIFNNLPLAIVKFVEKHPRKEKFS
ncbi:MAG: hypothetical protein KR126chlam5_00507 [Candidatus Anoxychlamydiales bacterium]|nr:hypothetical protein [Candidatus Anoxychlamydiales bacterium]